VIITVSRADYDLVKQRYVIANITPPATDAIEPKIIKPIKEEIKKLR